MRFYSSDYMLCQISVDAHKRRRAPKVRLLQASLKGQSQSIQQNDWTPFWMEQILQTQSNPQFRVHIFPLHPPR